MRNIFNSWLNMSLVAIYVPYPNKEEAVRISDTLLSEKLIACYNLSQVESSYWWEWSITRSGEIVSLLKTKKEYWEKVKNRVLELHSYDIPCILKFDIEANDEYENWASEQLT
jgi:periplasmic divalent cation tolerance protein